VLIDTFRSRGLTDKSKMIRISCLWSHAVGAAIASQTAPCGFYSGTLRIAAHSPVWQHQLIFLKDELIQKLNNALPGSWVRDIHVLAGVRPRPPPPPPPKPPQLCLTDAQELRVDRTAAAIGDDDTRHAFTSLMRRGLGDNRT